MGGTLVGVIDIVGCGPGGREFLTFGAWRAIRAAQVRIGSRRLLSQFRQGEHIHLETVRVGEVLELLARHAHLRCAVLVSGDPRVCSLAAPLVKALGIDAVRIHPGISSLQLASARTGADWGGARLVSHHVLEGRPDCANVFVIGGSRDATERTRQLRADLGGTEAIICRNLSLDDEEVRTATSEEVVDMGGLSVLVLRPGNGPAAVDKGGKA